MPVHSCSVVVTRFIWVSYVTNVNSNDFYLFILPSLHFCQVKKRGRKKAILSCLSFLPSETQPQFCVTGVLGATHVEIEHHLEMGRKLLAAGQLAEALSHYHSAVGKITHTDMQTLI